jgi:hypothetical protein
MEIKQKEVTKESVIGDTSITLLLIRHLATFIAMIQQSFKVFLLPLFFLTLSSSSPVVHRTKRIVSHVDIDSEFFNPNHPENLVGDEIEEEGILAPNALASRDAPKTTPDGDYIVEGDIVIPKQVIESQLNGSDGLTGRTAVAEPVLYWPGGVVVYSYHSCECGVFMRNFHKSLVSK